MVKGKPLTVSVQQDPIRRRRNARLGLCARRLQDEVGLASFKASIDFTTGAVRLLGTGANGNEDVIVGRMINRTDFKWFEGPLRFLLPGANLQSLRDAATEDTD